MTKETKKQIKAQVINDVQKQFARKVADVESSRDYWRTCATNAQEECRQLRINARKLEEENGELKQKVLQYEDWVERMQEFCGLPDGERQKAFTTYMDGVKAQTERDETLKHTADFFGHFTSMLFR